MLIKNNDVLTIVHESEVSNYDIIDMKNDKEIFKAIKRECLELIKNGESAETIRIIMPPSYEHLWQSPEIDWDKFNTLLNRFEDRQFWQSINAYG